MQKIKNMSQSIIEIQKTTLNRNRFLLKKKAAFLDELLSFIEDKSLGYLMEEAEKEENIPLAKAKKLLR